MRRVRTPSPATRATLWLLAEHADGLHGYDITRATGVAPGTLYPMLARLESQGILSATWHPAAEEGRPPRHVYTLTAAGVAYVRQLRAELGRESPSLRTREMPT